MTYVRNCWYVAGHSEEAVSAPFMRTYLDEPVMIYRASDGEVIAMDDRCPHRFAPLHKGKLIGDAIECPYHGLRFDRTGACVGMPLGGEAPPRAKVKTYPLIDRHQLLWIWMGESHLADAELIPDFSNRAGDDFGWFTGTLHCKANYQLLVDNLLDLTHSQFLHPFLSSDGWAARNKQTVSWSDGQMTIRNVAEEDNILPVMSHFKPGLSPVGTTIQTETWDAPALVRLSVDYYSDGDSLIMPSAHMLTPETEYTTHYFVRGGQNIDIHNVELKMAMQAGVLAVFQNEDIPMIEDQQRYLGERDLLEQRPAVLIADQGAIQVRRHISRLIRAEQQGATAAVAAE